jgi:hypothetical protein
VAVYKIEGVGKELDKIFIAITDSEGLRVICREKKDKEFVKNEDYSFSVPAQKIPDTINNMVFSRFNYPT